MPRGGPFLQVFAAGPAPKDKSSISLDDPDPLLTRHRDAVYAANMTAGWAERYKAQPVGHRVGVKLASSAYAHWVSSYYYHSFATMSWHARLQLHYALENARTVARFEHSGPLRILQSLYPEGHAVCHNVLVHPPGGLVGGDTLEIAVTVGPGAHALITTPGATRFYRSNGERALQRSHLALAEGARMEWLPLEALCYNGCDAENHLTLELAPGAECMGWDVTALGLPHADQPFAAGRFMQHIEMPGAWLERGAIDAADQRLLQSPLGLAGRRCLGSMFLVAGAAFERARRDDALDAARAVIGAHALTTNAGATSPNGRVVVVRVLAEQVEPVMALLKAVRVAWREAMWGLKGEAPRVWAM
jgi:urease accessory protein